MKRKKREKHFATEADLCAAFIAALPDGWTPYAETAGWDILLVRDEDGFQIGVQAKLRLNVDVINQAIEDGGSWYAMEPMPDCRAVLVPEEFAGAFDKICGFVGLTVIRMRSVGEHWSAFDLKHNGRFAPRLPKGDDWSEDWRELAPTKRHPLPSYVPDVRAGSASPITLTEWKIKALKIAVLIERRGGVTRKDFSHFQLDHRRWVAQGWLKVEHGRYVPDAPPDFKKQHPKVYKQIADEFDEWAPPTSLVEIAETPRLPL